MADIEKLARSVGVDRFRRACQYMIGRARDTGHAPARGSSARDLDVVEDLEVVPHELAELVESDLGLAMALYRAMPCYANLMYLAAWAPQGSLLREVRTLLDAPDEAVAAPATYWLWCGPFEDDVATAAAAWSVMSADASSVRLRRLLEVCGPVPWSAKGPLLTALARDPAWHPAIWRAVHAGLIEVFGRVDPEQARRLLAALTAPPTEIDQLDLRRRLKARAEHR